MPPFESVDDDSDMPLEQDVACGGESLPDMVCPSCRSWVTEDTPKCPHCGDWITPVDHPKAGGIRTRRWIFVIAVLLMLLGILRFAL